jgi:pyruvate kinase
VSEQTKVVATLGPATSDPEHLAALVAAGVDVFRLNFSHGERHEHLERIRMIREASAKAGGKVAILGDLQGPKIRVGKVDDAGIALREGETVTLVAGTETAPQRTIPVVYPGLATDCKPGDRILLDDGNIALKVLDTNGHDQVRATVLNSALLKSRKGINLPGVAVSATSLTEKDKRDLALAVEGGVDYVAQSFVRRTSDVLHTKQELRALGSEIPVVAKLERPEALEDLDGILTVSDAVMVARGDLGVEVEVEKVPAIQKHIIARANAFGVPVITATQMLESMITNPRPTRAEASDVANAVFDGTDAVMLSGETAVGAYPVAAVTSMVRIIREAEAAPQLLHPPPPPGGPLNVAATICRAAVSAAADLRARAIVPFTETGSTARFVSRFRPHTPIVGLSPYESTRRKMALYWGVEAAGVVDRRGHLHEMLDEGDERLIEGGYAQAGDLVVVLAGTPGGAGATNRVIVHRVGEVEGGRRV